MIRHNDILQNPDALLEFGKSDYLLPDLPADGRDFELGPVDKCKWRSGVPLVDGYHIDASATIVVPRCAVYLLASHLVYGREN